MIVKLHSSRFLALAAVFIGFLAPGSALLAGTGRITGQVSNGTTGTPAARQTLQLLMPRGGMQQVANAVTDADGRFVLDVKDVAADSFYLLQAISQGVNYHAPVKFDDRGQARVDLTIYDATHTLPAVRVQSARIILHAEGGKVHVQEMFAVRNNASPPRSYVNPDGTFLMHLSQTASDPAAAVAGIMNMPLPQPLIPGTKPGDYAMQYPLKPGLTVMMVAYDADYGSNKLDLADSVGYPVDALELLVLPPNLSVNSAIFKPTGTDAESGGQKLRTERLAPGTQFTASISGEPGTAEAGAGGGAGPAGRPDGEVKTLPNSMTRMGGLLLACFLLVLLWGLGVRVTKEWPKWRAQRSASQLQKALEAEVESLFNSLADVDELFAAGKIAEKPYWKERLELKARLVAKLKKAPPALLESYATRHTPQ